MILTGQPDSERLEGRNGEIWRAFIKGNTQERIAEEFGITQQTVSASLARTRAAIPAVDRGEVVQESLELIREVQRRAMELVDMAPAPVFVGKDGALAYDEDGNPVKDYSMRLKALDSALRANDVIARRLGLDAATKIESTASVRFEIVGVDVDGDLR